MLQNKIFNYSNKNQNEEEVVQFENIKTNKA